MAHRPLDGDRHSAPSSSSATGPEPSAPDNLDHNVSSPYSEDPIFPVLASLQLDPQDFLASTGPTAPSAPIGHFGSRTFQLPLDGHQRERILRSAWLLIFRAVPAVSRLLPNLQKASADTVTPEKAVDFLASHDFSLHKAQRVVLSSPHSASSSTSKGKQPAHSSLVSTPSRSSSRLSSRASTPSLHDDHDRVDDLHVDLGTEYSEERRGMPCGHVFSKGEAIWRCRDCALDDTCVQCAPCFMASIHKRDNHDVVFSVSSNAGGCCDCGDEEAWVKDVGCTYHSHQPAPTDDENLPDQDTSADEQPLDLAREVLQGLGSTASDDFATAIRRPLGAWLNFILATLNHGPEDQKLYSRSFVRGAAFSAAQKVTSLQGLDDWAAGVRDGGDLHQHSASSAQSSAQPATPRRTLPKVPGAYDFEQYFDLPSDSPANPNTPGGTWGTLPVDPNSPLPNQRQDARLDRKYALILWNDEKHGFKEVIDAVQDALGVSQAEGRAIADRVDQHGRQILAVSSDVNQLVSYVRRMNTIDLEITIRPAFDVFCEELSHCLISIIKEIADANAYSPSSASGELKANASTLRLLVCSELLEEWSPFHRKADAFLSPYMDYEYFDPRMLCKLDGMLLMDQKLWKEARSLVRGWYMAVVARKEGRRTVAFRFAAMYAKIIETFLLREREPEYSVVLITVQLFSVPSIGSDLVKYYNFLHKLLVILHSIYTGHLVPGEGVLKLPPDAKAPHRAIPEATLLRQMSARHIFYDVRYLLQSDGVKEQMSSDFRHIFYCTDFLALFTAILPEVRQTGHHIEFEANELWIAVFQVCSTLARQAKLMGEAFEKANTAQLTRFIDYAIRRTILSCLKLHELDPDSHSHPHQHKVDFGNDQYQVNEFRVDQDATSFHHPLHWFLSELTKRLNVVTETELSSMGLHSVDDLFPDIDQDGLLCALDFPLRVIVKIAQTKVGLWVRNGSSTRGQAAHYRDVAMRATMYDQDLFLVQGGLALVRDPDRLLVNMLDRFQLLAYFNGQPRSNSDSRDGLFDEDLERLFAEEFMLFLHYLVSEPSAACDWPAEKIIRREIIQYLALNQGNYSSLIRHIPDHMTDHPSFERLLSQVSNFRAPDGITDMGVYELKSELFAEINPFFYHYTRNQREKAEDHLRNREKKAGRSPEEFVHVPRKGLFGQGSNALAANIGRVFSTYSLRRILFYALWNNTQAESDKELPEALLDVTLQIIMVGLVEQGSEFVEDTLIQRVQHAGHSRSDGKEIKADISDMSILGYLCILEDRIKVKTLKAKVTWCLNEIDTSHVEGSAAILSSHRRTKSPPAQNAAAAKGKGAQQTLEAKRAAARARQQAIMQKFSAQQKTLLETLEKEGDSEAGPKKEDSMDLDDDVEGHAGMDLDDQDEEEPLGACILCQDDLKRDGSFGRLGLISHSTMIRTTPRNDLKALKDVAQVPLTLDRVEEQGQSRITSLAQDTDGEKYNPRAHLGSNGGGFPRGDHKNGFVTSTCGHLLHVRCFELYYRGIEHRHTAQIARNHPEDPGRLEYVCPLCKSLGNVILPVPDTRHRGAGSAMETPQKAASVMASQELDQTPMGEWLRKINIDILRTSGSQYSSAFQETATGTGCFSHWYTDNALAFAKDASATPLPDNVDEHTLAMLIRMIAALRPVATSTRSARVAWQSRTILAPVNRKMYFPEEVVGYTLSAMEISQRGLPASRGKQRSNVAHGISDNNIGLVRSLIFCMRSIAAVEAFNLPAKQQAAKDNFSNAMRQGLYKRLLPHWSSDEVARYPLLLRDPLTILIEAAAITPEYLSQVTTLMYYAALVQTVFGLAQPSVWPQAPGSTAVSRGLAHLEAPALSAKDKAALKQCFPDVRWTVGNMIGVVGYARGNISSGVDNLNDETLAKMLCTYTLPFLRRAAILRRAICGDHTFDHVSSLEPGASSEPVEYLRLLADLQIPPPAQALPVRAERQSAISGMIEGWLKHAYAPLASLFRPLPINPTNLSGSNGQGGGSGASVGSTKGHGNNMSTSNPAWSHQANLYLAGGPNHQILQLEHPHIYELVALPKDLTELLQYSQQTICRRCKQTPPEPALCLFCGELVCYQTFCCMDSDSNKGECNRHVAECGNNIGLFFKLKANVIFILYYVKGTFTASPYLDSHGEVDYGLQKGRPQRLHRQRADELRRLWLTGGLPTIAARKLESSMDAGGWDAV